MLFPSLKLERVSEDRFRFKTHFWNRKYPLRPEVPLKFTILSFQIHFWKRITILNEIFKPEVPFPNRKYLFKTANSIKNHDF